MLRSLIAAMVCGLVATSSALAGETGRVDQILERLNDANQWRDHVMVVAHRGGGLAGAKRLFPENSRAALEAAIALGAEMAELDVQKTKDGVYVVLHDSWLDRTTTCRGQLVQFTLADLAGCRLVVEGTGAATDEPIPSFRDMLEVARGRILINIDNKLAPAELAGMVAVASEMGMARQIVVKQNLWDGERVEEARRLVAQLDGGVTFMPIIADDAVRDVGFLEEATRAVDARAAELINWRDGAERLTDDGGPLFSMRARAVATRGNWHIWVNTYAIVNKAGGFLAGGRGDELAVAASMPMEAYGFWVDRGATIIQTDEPEAAIGWLEANGYRVPYASPEVTAGSFSQ